MERTMIKIFFALLISCVCAFSADAQVILQKAVVSNAGGTTANATTRLEYTVGETAVGVASNSTSIGRFGFWNAATFAALVKGNGAGSIKAVTVHPNPASNMVSIEVDLAAAGNLDLLLYDEAGHLVSTLYSGRRAAGTHTVRADIQQLATGTYLIAALVPGGLLQSRLTVIR
jgi:type IX secretion system substrate protein